MHRPVDIADWEVSFFEEPNGIVRIRPTAELGPYPVSLTDRLEDWASQKPDQVFLARRQEPRGAWVTLTYRQTMLTARNVAQHLLAMGLTADRPIVILSGNDLEHAVVGLAAMYAGIPYAPLSPAYSLVSRDFSKLRHIMGVLRPGLVFAADGLAFGHAINEVVPGATRLVVKRNPPADREAILFESLSSQPPSAATVLPASNAGAIAKILFTSGSTGIPKGVINTQRMLCSNQEMLVTVLRCLRQTPPVICDWLPWNHTFGGNHNFGLVLYNGGTLYIDDGKPAGHGLEETLHNLREIAPTVYFNVPKGYQTLVDQLAQDEPLRRNFFSRLELTFYAAAGLGQHVWDALDDLAIATCGQRITMLTGLGSTETAPFALCANKQNSRSGVVGLPVPGLEMKLVPQGPKLEVRVKGPNVTPGYWGEPDLTQSAFDEEGFYRMGDALRWLDPASREQGLDFDGRLAEDFKLSTGTWVSAGPLRARFLAHFAPLVRDVVIAGHDRDHLVALVFPELDECRRLEPGPATQDPFAPLLQSFAATSTGSSNRIELAVILHEPPSLDLGEITDKGSINQREVLSQRADLVEALYAASPAPEVIARFGRLVSGVAAA